MLKRCVLVGISALLLLFAAACLYYLNEVHVARSDTGVLVAQAFHRYGHRVTINDFTPQRLDTLLRIEDPTFRRHRGVDLSTPGAGMTTITQGLVKLLYFPGGFRPGIAKIRQTLIAEYAFGDLVSKDNQLELYLNATYFGSVSGKPIHGIASAAETYFAKSHRDLTDDEFISLIGMTIAPNELKPGTAKSDERLVRIKKFLAGEIRACSVLDVEYLGKTRGTFLEEALMSMLRLVTHADPNARELLVHSN
jgi:membrane carboxypeptidase/penicillin-binding protein